MQTLYTVIPPQGESSIHQVDLPLKPGYDLLKSIITPLIGGGWLEHVSVLWEGKRTYMFVDDEGLLKDMERNEQATAIYRANALSQQPSLNPEYIDFIVGTAVLFHRRVWF